MTDAARHDGAQLTELLDKTQHGRRRLGRYRLSLEEERGVPRRAACASSSTARSRRAGRCRANIARANAAKSRVRSAIEHVFARQKGPMGLVRPHHRHRPGDREDRPRQSRLQHAAPGLARQENCARLTEIAAVPAGDLQKPRGFGRCCVIR